MAEKKSKFNLREGLEKYYGFKEGRQKLLDFINQLGGVDEVKFGSAGMSAIITVSYSWYDSYNKCQVGSYAYVELRVDGEGNINVKAHREENDADVALEYLVHEFIDDETFPEYLTR